MDPYKLLRISRNADGSLTRGAIFPLSPPSSSDAVLCRDLLLDSARGTGIRLFLPSPSPPPSGCKLPVIVYFHGGGFIIFRAASLPFHDFCSRLAVALPAVVLSVDYRLAPEHRLPAAFDDALDALLWLRAHATGASVEGNLPFPLTECADFSRCFLCGDSAGATIAFHAALRAGALQDSLAPLSIAGLVLDQPYFGGIERTESEEKLKNGKVLSLPENDLMWELALPEGADRDHEYSNPFKNEEKLFAGLRDFPRCLVRGHTGDPLLDRQKEFARMLQRRGVSVVTSLESDGCHGVELIDPIKEAEALADAKRFICGDDGDEAPPPSAPIGSQTL
ncbi:putative carboxylesterase 8 [Curcuma longa]|uniref:putative carboxylesterase 8 n=1 Tax=Curcuma longa TaxID=136217 RepID=UPI003D9E86B7